MGSEGQVTPLKEDKMKLIAGPAGVASPGRLGLLAAALMICSGCAKREAQTPAMALQAGPKATHMPPFVMLRETILGRKAEVMDHIQKQLVFDSGAAVDQRPLFTKNAAGNLVVGPNGVIAPEAGATLLDASWAWADTGRVLAKITVADDYPLLHLKKGVTYVCVRRSAKHPLGGNVWAFLIGIAGNTVRDIDSLPLRVKNTTGPARWVVGSTDDNFCAPCNARYCCTEQ